MAVCKMQRVTVFGLQKDRKATLERLQAWGVMEVDSPASEEGFSRTDTLAARQRYDHQVQTLGQALEVLDRYAPAKTSLLAGFAGREHISRSDYEAVCARRDAIVNEAHRVLTLDKEIAEQKASVARLQNQIEGLAPWLPLDVPMSFRGTKTTRMILGLLPGVQTREGILSALAAADTSLPIPDVEVLTQGKDYTYIAALAHSGDASALEEALRGIGFARPSQTCDRTPAEATEAYRTEILAAEEEIRSREEQLAAAGADRDDFRILSDYFRIRSEKYEVLGTLPQSRQTFFITGYVPAEKSEALAADLQAHCGAAVEIEELPEGEEAPVLLKNGAVGGMTEGIVKSFGLPAPSDMDPSFFTTLFYIFFFGLMLSDAIYGLMITVACAVALKALPNMEEGLRKTARLFFWCGLSTTFWGVMFGGYFGNAIDVIAQTFFGRAADAPPLVPPLWFAPIDDPTRLLIFSMLFGLIHLLFGLGLKGYLCLTRKDYMGFFFGVVCWFLLLGGLVIILLPTELFHGISQMTFVFPPALVTAGKVLALVGAAGILLMSASDKKNPFLRIALGAYDLYGISGWLSDVLSYSRLLALGLATGVIANVINQMCAMFGGGILGAIPFTIVFLIGHVLNFAINVLGAYVHTCRLQYVEFYGKFYESGGREFAPFMHHTNYITIKEEQ